MAHHVAIIMDGNGRWATERGLPRLDGHHAGVAALRRVVAQAGNRGLSHLTVFGFSTENWRRPEAEVDGLFNLLRRYIVEDLAQLAREGVRLRIVGRRERLPPDVCAAVADAERLTSANTALHLTIAFDYGGRDEILRAAQAMAKAAMRGEISPCDMQESDFERYLDTGDLPPPDLIIRTSGERRLSNFMLWGAAYAEILVLSIHWPDMDAIAFDEALAWFSRRQRRFGGLEDGASEDMIRDGASHGSGNDVV